MERKILIRIDSVGCQRPLAGSRKGELTMYPVARNTFLALSVLLSSGLSGIALDAQTIAWTDWTSATTGNPGSAVGTNSSTSSVGVSYNGQILFAQTLGQGIDYWIPSTPFLSTTVTNAPPDSDIIALT